MRTIYGILAVSALMFLGGLAFMIVGVRSAGRAPAPPTVATTRQLMQGLVAPASAAIYNAVSTTVTAEGTKEVFPRSDREWEIVGSHAVTLIEAANLLKADGRAQDSSTWMRMSDAMANAARQSYQAAEKKSVEALLASGEVLNNSCDACHRRYEVAVE